MSNKKSQGKSQRQLQVNERIKRSVAEIFSNSGLSTIAGAYVTILEADTSPDMKNCKIFVDVFGGDDKKMAILDKLNEISPRVRMELGKDLTMRSTPNLKFVLDESSQNAIDIDNLINQESQNFNNE